MSLQQLTYLMSIFLFAGGALLIELALVRRDLRPYARFLGAMALLGIMLTAILEPPALGSRAWVYGQQNMLDVHVLGAEIETFLYSALLLLFAGIATIVLADHEEKGDLTVTAMRKYAGRILPIRPHVRRKITVLPGAAPHRGPRCADIA